MYAVCSQVPVRLTYRNGEVKVRYLWRFRAPTPDDLEAVRAAGAELERLRPRWQAQGLALTEEIPEGEKTREPRIMGQRRWEDLFLPRQTLTNTLVLEEVRAAQAKARVELPAEEAEAVAVYLAFLVSKVVNYNSLNTFWHYGRKMVTQTFSRHDFAFRPAFCEFEGARETVVWAANQVIGAYEAIAGLVHGETVSLEGGEDDDGDPETEESGGRQPPVDADDEDDDEGQQGADAPRSPDNRGLTPPARLEPSTSAPKSSSRPSPTTTPPPWTRRPPAPSTSSVSIRPTMGTSSTASCRTSSTSG
jgi:putative DNA methylase